MRLLPQEKDRTHTVTIVIVVLIMVISFAAAVMVGFMTRDSIKEQLGEECRSFAAIINASSIAQLKGDPSDTNTDAYKALKAQLSEAKSINPNTRTIYIFGSRNNNLFYYVDSEQPGTADFDAAGSAFSDASDLDIGVFKTGASFVEGPLTTNHKGSITAVAPIYLPGTRNMIAALGIDLNTTSYWSSLIYASLVPFLAGTTLALTVYIFERMRRNNSQLLSLRSELVSVASHELRNPITGIRWAAESMKKMTTDERVLKISDAILDSALRLQASTNDILELSHATSGRRLDLKPTDISALMHEVVETQSLSAQQKNVAVIFDKYWPNQLTIRCDTDQMRRALHNVVSNAIKYTKNDSVVTISFQQDAKNYKILVIDQGIGIPLAEQNKVFRGFYRASNAVRSDIPGTGLGLYLVKTVFEAHGGSVDFTSQENRGTTFILTLPR